MDLFQYSKKVDGDYPGPSYLIHKECFGKKSLIDIRSNMEIAAVLQPSAAGAKAVRRMYLKISAEKKAEIGQRAAEHGMLATVPYEGSGTSRKCGNHRPLLHPRT